MGNGRSQEKLDALDKAEEALRSGHWPRHVCEEIATSFLGLNEAYIISLAMNDSYRDEIAELELAQDGFKNTIALLRKDVEDQFKAGHVAGERERSLLGEQNKNLSIELGMAQAKLFELNKVEADLKEARNTIQIFIRLLLMIMIEERS